MHPLKTILRSNQGNATSHSTAPSVRQTSRLLPRVGALLKGLSLAAGLLLLAHAQLAEAQTAPAYLVYSQTLLSNNFNGIRQNVAVNSRGDFFAQDGNGHVLEYPANGSAAITLFTDTNNYGTSGVAVDPFDNLYITVFYGPGGNADVDSQIYEFPSTNGSYPSPYIYNSGKPPGSCNPAVAATPTTAAVVANTGVCAVGLYQGAAYYYWQPVGIAADGQGNTYMVSQDDNENGAGGSHTEYILQCQISCNEQLAGNGATLYTIHLPTSISSLIADYAGDVYFTDLSNVYFIPAGSPSTGNVPAVFDSSYTSPYGITLDASGNMYVSDANGIWKVPAVETSGGAPCKGGTDKCKLVPSAKYKVIPLAGVPVDQKNYAGNTSLPYETLASAAVDNRGNIIYSPNGATYNNDTDLFEASLFSGVFPATQIAGTGASPLQFTVSFDSATTIASFNVVQGSVPATEFAVSLNTCTAGPFAANSTCTFSVAFTPSGLGVRTGAIVITDSTGKSTTTNLTGVGTGTGVTVDPGTPTQIGSGFKTPAGIAIDKTGNVYVADSTAGKVLEYPAGGGASVSLGTGLSVPVSVAVDGAGNAFILNQGTGATGGSVVEVPNVAGVLTSSAQTTLVTGLDLPTDIIVDGSGNLFISATGANQVLQLSSASIDSGSAAMIVRGYGLSGPTGLALDPSGNIYVADTGNNRVLQIGDGFQIAVGSGLTAPTGVATDPSGSVLIADGTGRLIRVPNESYGTNAIGLNQADQQVLSSPLSYPYSLRTDNTGNIYVSDSTAAVVYQLQRTTGTVNFGNWNLNTLSDAQTVVFSNIGTADVTLGNPDFAAVPAASEFFAVNSSSSTGCGGGLFHSGYNCTVLTNFEPTAPGLSTYPLVFNTTAQNTAAPTVNLVGTGVSEAAATLKLVQTKPTTSPITYGQQVIISAVVAPTTGSTPIPTGYIVFNFNGQNQRAIKLDATGQASITFNGLNAGSNTLTAYYEGDANYASLNSTVFPLVIQLATSLNVLTIVGDSATPLSAAPTNSFTLTDTLTPSVVGLFTGTVNFVDLTTGKTINTTPIRLGSPDPVTGLYVVSYTVLANAPTLGGAPSPSYALGGQVSGTIEAQYSGNTNYEPSASANLTYTVSIPTFVITPASLTVTTSASSPGTVNLAVTDYSNLQGNVSLQCSGLPANTYCVFRPASAQLIPASGILPNTQVQPLTITPVPVTLQIVVDQNPVLIQGSVFWIFGLTFGLGLLWRRKQLGGKLGLVSAAAILCMAGLATLSGCGSNSNAFPTKTGPYAATITATITPLNSSGMEPPCSYQNCNLPEDPVTNPSINIVKTLSVNLTVQ